MTNAVEGGRRPRALDLYCCAGGATRGLQLAGFHVTGVDIAPQPNYCGDRFIQGDALEYLRTADLSEYDLIWSSPPCQAYTVLRHAPGEHRDADLVAPTRAALKGTGKPYVIENVKGAPLINPITLCGSMFGLETDSYPNGHRIESHRLFETSFPLKAPSACRHDERPVTGQNLGHSSIKSTECTIGGSRPNGREVDPGTADPSLARELMERLGGAQK